MMTKKLKHLAALVLAMAMFSFSACTELDSNGNPIPSPPKVVQTQEQLFDIYLAEQVTEAAGDNLLDSRFLMRYPENFGLTDIPKTLYSMDFEELNNAGVLWQEEMDKLRSFNYHELTQDQQYIYDLLEYELELEKPVLSMQYYGEINSPMLGRQSNLPTLLAEFQLYTVQDAYDYITMLGTTQKVMDDMVEYQNRRSEQGLFMSDRMLDETIESCENFIENPEQNLLLDTFVTRLDALPDITPEQKEELIELNREAVNNSIIPAYKSFIEGMEALRGTGKNDGGICNLPDGRKYYEYMVAADTGSDRSVTEIIWMHDRALEQLMMNMGELMDGNTGLLERWLNVKLVEGDGLTPEGMMELLRERSQEQFPELPSLSYQVKYVHESMEEHTSPAFYIIPQIDFSGENAIYINRKYTGDDLDAILPTLAHEGYPGHMYQINYFSHTNPNPIRRINSYKGYSEGWATYVEQLSYELSDIGDDRELVELMQLNGIGSLLLSSRIDLGVNYEGWNKGQVGDCLKQYGYNSTPEVVDDIYSMVLNDPANYLSYCVGFMEFQKLREYAQEKLGDSFDPKLFHKAVLDVGPSPFSFVRKAVDEYIDTVKQGVASSSQAKLPNAA